MAFDLPHRIALGLLVFFTVTATSLADEFGTVVGVHDGDTVTIKKTDNTTVKIRLFGIDAPEMGQPFGNNAKQAMSGLVFGKQVGFSTNTTDRYGRVVSKLRLPDGRDAGAEMLRAGLAWHYVQYARKEKEYARLQADAKSAKLGLWKEPNPVPPWEWRRNEKSKRSPSPTR